MKFNRLYTLLAGAALTVAVAGGYVYYKWQEVETLTNKGPTRLFTVEKGAHAARLIAELGEGETSPWAVRLWLRSHPDDARLLDALGRMCLQQRLWGKAQSYLEASLAVEPTQQTHLELARLADQLERPEEANKHYRASALLDQR